MSSISTDSLSSAYMNQYLTQAENSSGSTQAASVSDSLSGISSSSSKEDLTDAVKSFESYFVEQMLKQFKDSIESINEDEDDSASSYVDMYFDSAISEVADTIVDQYGDRLTDTFVEQMSRTYNISDTSDSDTES